MSIACKSTYTSDQIKPNRYRDALQEFLNPADVQLNGGREWDIQVFNKNFYSAVLAGGSLALGEAYLNGWWECNALDQLSDKLHQAMVKGVMKRQSKTVWAVLRAKLSNLQKASKVFNVVGSHYNTSNSLFVKMLDDRMAYSSAYWKDATNLNEAQEAKLDLICRKIDLKPGMRVLDIGCGWGSFAKFAAEKYDVEVVGITISKEQYKLGNEMCEGLPVEIRLQDYRDVNERFDRVVSVGMVEHVGSKNYRSFMKNAKRCLVPDGLFLLHTIGALTTNKVIDPWVNKYIFPDSLLPSARHISKASEGLFIMEDWHNFGADYDKTLMAWESNFRKGWDSLKSEFNERFYRMWRYYLLFAAGSFRSRSTQLWQIVFSVEGVSGGYKTVR